MRSVGYTEIPRAVRIDYAYCECGALVLEDTSVLEDQVIECPNCGKKWVIEHRGWKFREVE